MPLVILSGLPCSGKTTRARQLKEYLTNQKNIQVLIVDDSNFGVQKNEVYADSKKEKELRSNLKSAVQRDISKETVLILDSANYIKGYRYELYCVTKSAQTPQCVLHCDINPEKARDWNSQRPEADFYNQDIFDGLVMRFEPPESRNRWDSPLFLVQADDDLPCEHIYDALFHRKAPPPNHSTLSQPLSATNFLHELDKITQTIVSIIMDAQKTSVPGDTVAIPGAKDRLELVRPLTLAELQRIRRQFISYTKTHPVEDTGKIANMFVQFLNSGIK